MTVGWVVIERNQASGNWAVVDHSFTSYRDDAEQAAADLTEHASARGRGEQYTVAFVTKESP